MTHQTQTSIRAIFWGLAALDLCIVLVGVFYVIVPDVRAWRRERSEVALVREARLAVEQALAPLEETAATTNAQQSLVSRLDAVLPSALDLPQVYDEVSDIIARSGLALSGLDVSDVAAEGTAEVRRVQITIRVSGLTYPTLKRLAELIELAPRLYDLRSVALSGDVSQASITLWTYAFAPISQP